MHDRPKNCPGNPVTRPGFFRTGSALLLLLSIALAALALPCGAADGNSTPADLIVTSRTTSPDPASPAPAIPSPANGSPSQTILAPDSGTTGTEAAQAISTTTTKSLDGRSVSPWIAWDAPADIRPALPQAGYGVSMVRDPGTGLLHISYLEYSNQSQSPGRLIYQNGTGTHWNEPVVVDDTIGFYRRDVPESARHTSIALDPRGNPHIVYMSWNEGYQLKYARMTDPGDGPAEFSHVLSVQANGSWTVATLPSPVGTSRTLSGWGAALAINNKSTVHISFLRQDRTTSPVTLAFIAIRPGDRDEKTGRRKVFVTAPQDITALYGGLPLSYWNEPVKAGMVTAMALDSGGRPRISYSGSPAGFQERYGTGNTETSACGYTETCFANLSPDYAAARGSIDSKGKASTYSWTIVPLKIPPLAADLRSPSRMKNTTYTRHTTLYSSVAIDRADNAHVSYSDSAMKYAIVFDKNSATITPAGVANTLYYSFQDGESFRTETVDNSSGMTGMYSSIRSDSRGNPRIAYIAGENGAVRFAARMNGTWMISTPPGQNQTAARYTSLVLDDSGNPAIVYLDTTTGRLKYLHGTLAA